MGVKRKKKVIAGQLAGAAFSFPAKGIDDILFLSYPPYREIRKRIGLYRTSLMRNLGIDVGVHELGHALTGKILYNPGRIEVQVDRWKYAEQLLKEPNLQNFWKLVGGEGKFGGKAEIISPTLTPFSMLLGDENSRLIVFASGTLAEIGACSLLYLLSRRVAKKNPATGAALAVAAANWNLSAITYPMQAIFLKPQAIETHDWINFASISGIDPTITTILLSLIFPTLIISLSTKDLLWARKARQREALERLLEDGVVNEKRVLNLSKRIRILEEELERRKGLGRFFERRKIKRSLKSLRKNYEKLLDEILKDEGIKALAEREGKLYDRLVDHHFEFQKDPNSFAKKFEKEEGAKVENLEERIKAFYDGEFSSALKVIS